MKSEEKLDPLSKLIAILIGTVVAACGGLIVVSVELESTAIHGGFETMLTGFGVGAVVAGVLLIVKVLQG